MDGIVTAWLSHGIVGLVAATMLLLFILKDRELTTERAARIADAKGYTQLALDLQKSVMDATKRLSDVFDAIRREKP